MGLSEHIQRGLAGLGAYLLCLLGLTLGPSGTLGGLFGPLLALLSLALVFIGGMQLALVNPACSGVGGRTSGPNIICAILCFLVFTVMASLALGPVQLALQLDMAEEIRDVSICEWSSWSDSGGGVFFVDGTTERPDRSGQQEPSDLVRLENCEWHSDGWESCVFRVQPVLACSEASDRCRRVCAWAVEIPVEMTSSRPHRPGGCGSRSAGGICGIAVSVRRLTAGRCAGPHWRDPYCHKVQGELANDIRDLAAKLSLTVGHETSRTRDAAPLLLLGDPEEAKEDLSLFLWIFGALGLLYLPLPLLAALCTTSLETSCPVVGPLARLCFPNLGDARGQEDDGRRYFAM
eukprot:TRINITY_DN94920_c0_g1_i1.p1 TRINITY_DN94920_c0_g1~~TRINITY_DN94920_c0_g1_i1.p1  ORF type:complete len:357 (-),score=69.33 TRINITY_DN94920_c0_g1_i1:32-1075(-)